MSRAAYNIDLSGCGTALVTPFRHGEVDYSTYRYLVKRQVEQGVDFLVALGTTAETPSLTLEERKCLLKITKEVAGDKVVLAGVGSNTTAETVHAMHHLEPCGADGFLVVTPYYNKPNQEGLYQHFRSVALSTDLPVVLYNVPVRTGVNLCAETTLKLALIRNIIAIKEASGNHGQIGSLIRNAPEGFKVLSGNDSETFSMMVSGASGVISVVSNIVPSMVGELTRLLLVGAYKEARHLHYKLWPLFTACFLDSNPIPVKAGMSLMGLLRNELRLPLLPANESVAGYMESVLNELKLLRVC